MMNINKNTLEITCDEFISVNHYMSYRAVKKGKFTTVMAYKPVKTKNFEKNFGEYIREQIKKQNWDKPIEGKFIILEAVFYFPRIDMDAQNYFKSLCDIMTEEGVWVDDNIVLEKVNRIYYDKDSPRIEIKIYEADFVGIFDTEDDYTEFKNKCEKCKRFKRNCSIHRQALESRIQKDVVKENNKWKCLKFN